MKILISAHEFSPFQGSECANGWNIVEGLSRIEGIDHLYVLYASGSQRRPKAYIKALSRYFDSNIQSRKVTYIAVDQPHITLFFSKVNDFFFKNSGSLGFPPIYFLGYNLWQRKVFKVTKKLMISKKIDLIHHINQVNFREPGYLWKFDVPFFWGPTGGTTGLCTGFLAELSVSQKLREYLRNGLTYIQLKFNPRIRRVINISAMIYLFSEADYQIFKKMGGVVKRRLDSGTSPEKDAAIRMFDGTKTLKLIWVGQLIERKGLLILLNALCKMYDVNKRVKVTILGDGPLLNLYKSKTLELGLTCVSFCGLVKRTEVHNYLKSSDFLFHTSYREGTAQVVPEALSTGLPVVCHDSFGIGLAVGDAGIKVPFLSFNKSVDGFQAAIESILFKPELVEQYSKIALVRAKEITWNAMCSGIYDDYLGILNENLTNK